MIANKSSLALVLPLFTLVACGGPLEDGSETPAEQLHVSGPASDEMLAVVPKPGEDMVTAFACNTVYNVSVNTSAGTYWYSSKMTTTGCGSTSNIRVSTSTMHGPTCASFRVRLFPSSGGEIVPRGFQFVCPGSNNVELANYIIAGTVYRVESKLGSATVTVVH